MRERWVSEWELLVYTRQFSQEWQGKDLEDTENEGVRKYMKGKDENRGAQRAFRRNDGTGSFGGDDVEKSQPMIA
jgi:hypothetical protein